MWKPESEVAQMVVLHLLLLLRKVLRSSTGRNFQPIFTNGVSLNAESPGAVHRQVIGVVGSTLSTQHSDDLEGLVPRSYGRETLSVRLCLCVRVCVRFRTAVTDQDTTSVSRWTFVPLPKNGPPLLRSLCPTTLLKGSRALFYPIGQLLNGAR